MSSFAVVRAVPQTRSDQRETERSPRRKPQRPSAAAAPVTPWPRWLHTSPRAWAALWRPTRAAIDTATVATDASAPAPACDMDGDLLIESPAEDRIADVPLLQMTDQQLTVGLTPELSASTIRRSATELTATLHLQESFHVRMSGLLSIEGGLNLNSAFKSATPAPAGGGTSPQTERRQERSDVLGLNAKHALEYDLKSQAEMDRVAKRVRQLETTEEARLGVRSGFISIQFKIQNTGRQAVELSGASFAVASRFANADGTERVVTIVPEQAVPATQPSLPPNLPTPFTVTLAPGETRTISLRLEGQDTSTILELLGQSRATWATLHFGKQVAITDPRVLPDGTVVRGEARDVSRDLVSSLRKHTIPFLFEPPPLHGELGAARTSLLAAAPAPSADHADRCAPSDHAVAGATLPELFQYHDNLTTDWGNAFRLDDAAGPRWILNQVGPVASTLGADVDMQWLSTLPTAERQRHGRWELTVLHRDYGPTDVPTLRTTRLNTEHLVALRWVNGQALLERAAGTPVHESALTLNGTAITPIGVQPGGTATLRFQSVEFKRPLLEEQWIDFTSRNGDTVRHFSKVERGTQFALDRLRPEPRQQLRIRYAIVSRAAWERGMARTAPQLIPWHDLPVPPNGVLHLPIPDNDRVPEDAVVIAQPYPVEMQRREGQFIVRSDGSLTPRILSQFPFGWTVRDHLPVILHGTVEVLPARVHSPTPPRSVS
ncbi:MAG: hypothetical protein HY696_04845 [Deltaproteobacteria bacterium]|nr:hypothetical protein [Deltaproteobacteria bacterium]